MKQRKYVANNQWTTRNMTVWERFWTKVDAPVDYASPGVMTTPYSPRTECWSWLAAHTHDGYGMFWLDGHYKKAHRIAYELAYDCTIPDGMEIDHLCRNRICVRPNHLEVVTPRVNQLRGNGVGGTSARKTHCPQGHPYSPENTYVFTTARGGLGRQCKTCRRERYVKRRT